MSFLWPSMLWLLLAVPLLVAAYLWLLRRRKRLAVRYAGLAMVREAMTAGQGRYTIALSHYEAVPPAVQQELTRGWQARDDE